MACIYKYQNKNYTEEEFKSLIRSTLPKVKSQGIVPSIQSHAQFKTENGIGWFRSDDKIDEEFLRTDKEKEDVKTRRILEVQSDLFQKGRDNKFIVETKLDREIKEQYGDEQSERITDEYRKKKGDEGIKENQFLQLLNKDNNWVTFFVKSIIQDSAKKGYEKVLFPTGNTASKVEGHTTLEEFKKQKEDRLETLENNLKLLEENPKEAEKQFEEVEFADTMEYAFPSSNEKTTVDERKTNLKREIKQLKQELERVETEGFGALKPIYNFYENTVKNILKKNYKINEITDEYGNTWNEITLTEKQRQEIILLSKITGEIDNSKTQLSSKITQSFKHEVLGQATAMATKGKVSSGLSKIANDILKWIKDALNKIGFRNVNTIKTFKDLKQVFEDNNVRIDLKKFTGVTLNEKEVDELVGGFVKYGTKNIGGSKSSNNSQGILFSKINEDADFDNDFPGDDYIQEDYIPITDFGEIVSRYDENTINGINEFSENRVSNKASKIILKQREILNSLEQELKRYKGLNNEGSKKIEQRIQLINTSLNNLKNNFGIDALLFIQLRGILDCNESLDNYSLTPQFGNDIRYAQGFQENSRVLLDLLAGVREELTKEQKEQYYKLRDQSDDLFKRINEVSTKYLKEHSTEFGDNYDPNEAAKDINVFTKNLLSVDQSDISELKAISKLKDWYHAQIHERVQNLKDTISNLKVDNYKEKLKSFFDLSGKFITKTKNEFFEEQRKIYKLRDDILNDSNSSSTAKALAYKEKNLWFKNNTDYILDKNSDLYKSYLKDRENFIFSIQSLEKNEFGEYDYDPGKLNEWEIRHSPESWIEYMDKISLPGYTTGIRPIDGYKYLYVVPKEKWNNPDFEKIKDDELYKLIVKIIKEGTKLIPNKMFINESNFDKVLNQFTIDLTDLDPWSLKNLLGGMKESFYSWFKAVKETEEEPLLSYDTVDSKGNPKNLLLSPDIEKFKNSSSDNLLDTLTSFYEMAQTFNMKSEVLPIMDLYLTKLKAKRKIKTKKRGLFRKSEIQYKKLLDNDGNVVYKDGKPVSSEEPDTIEGGLLNAIDLVLYTIQSDIFDQKKTDENPETAKVIDKVINFTRSAGIWLKPFTALGNLGMGLNENFKWAISKKDFTDKEYWQSFKMLFQSALKGWTLDKIITPEARKFALLMDRLGVKEAGFSIHESDWKSKFNDYMYTLMTSGEYLIHGQGLIAKMLYTELTKLNGTKGNLWDYIIVSEDGKSIQYNHKEYGELTEWESQEDKNGELFNFMREYKNYRVSSQGDYTSNLKVKEKVGGRAAMIYRTWLPQAIEQRFGSESEDRNFKGRYLTYADLFKGYSKLNGGKGAAIVRTMAKVLAESVLLYKTDAYKAKNEEDYKKLGLSEIDIQNMRINIREIRLIVLYAGLAITLGAMAGGGEPDPEATALSNLSQRLYQDLSFFYVPTSALSIIRNPIPVFTTIQNSMAFLSDASVYLYNPSLDIYQQGYYKGHSKTGVQFLKTVPGLAAIPGTIAILQNKFNNQSYQFSK